MQFFFMFRKQWQINNILNLRRRLLAQFAYHVSTKPKRSPNISSLAVTQCVDSVWRYDDITLTCRWVLIENYRCYDFQRISRCGTLKRVACPICRCPTDCTAGIDSLPTNSDKLYLLKLEKPLHKSDDEAYA